MNRPSTSLLNRFLAISYVAFWATIFTIRIVELIALAYNRFPGIVIERTHIHHFITGFILLLVFVILELLLEVNDAIKAIIFGIGLALIADEILYWTLGRYSYWNYANCVGTLLIALLLLITIYYTLESEVTNTSHPVVYKKISRPHHSPFISVVIPAYNEEKYLAQTLRSLQTQDYGDTNFEIIVVDNNSSDATAAIAREFGARVVEEKRIGVAAARQTGFMSARGGIIATTDADTILPVHWLSNIAGQFEARPEMVAYGGLFSLYSGPLSARLIFPDIAYLVFVVYRLFTGAWTLAGSNLSVRAKAFHQIGGFNLEKKTLEDADLAQRISRIGAVILDYHNVVRTSGRRFKKGLVKGALPYAAGTSAMKIMPRALDSEFISIRDETYGRYNFLYPLIPAFALIMIFALHNSAIREGQETDYSPVHASMISIEQGVDTKEQTIKNDAANVRKDHLPNLR